MKSSIAILVTLVLCCRAHPVLPEDNPLQDPVLQEELMAFNDTATELDNNGTLTANDTETNIDNILKTVRVHNAEVIDLGRDKERRLEIIRMAILNSTGRSATPNAPAINPFRDIMEQLLKSLPWANVDEYTEKVQSFYPVCLPPKAVDARQASPVEERDPMSLFLNFNLSYPVPLEGTVLNIVAARLKLYKVSQDPQTSQSTTMLPCLPRRVIDTAALEAVATAAAVSNAPGGPMPLPATIVSPAPYVDDDRRIRVSVYLFTRANKKNRLRRKLLDTKMLPVSGSEWVDLNVRLAARTWRNASRNFGLVIEVEDEEGKSLAASKFFKDMNCSKEASTSRPIPSIVVDAARERNENSTFEYNTDLFPVIDLCTVEQPKAKPASVSPTPPPTNDLAPSYIDLQTKEGDATSVVLFPFHKLSELQSAKKPAVDEPEELEASKNVSSEAVQPAQEQILEEVPALKPAAHYDPPAHYEPALPHPHRHHRNRAHSHEDLSGYSSADWPPEEEENSEEKWSRPHRLHPKLHHRHHEDWSSESSKRIVILPASELRALSQKMHHGGHHQRRQR